MGLFLTDDGRFHSWLAAILCCCAVSEDESPYEKERERERERRKGVVLASSGLSTRDIDALAASAQPQPCNAQPLRLAELPATPSLAALPHPASPDDILPNPIDTRHPPVRPPAIKPLHLEAGSLLGREPHHGRKRSSFGHAKRLSISAPHSFRRLDAPEPIRQSLVPLRLGPVVLSQSREPRTESPATRTWTQRERSDSIQDLLSPPHASTYQAQRETPYERCQARSSVVVSARSQEPSDKALKRSASAEDQRSVRRSASTKRSSGSLRRDERNASPLVPSHSSSERSIRRKGSFQIRKPSAEAGDMDPDKEVLELNTIVEERRAEAAREKQGDGDQHVAAIAPSMQIRARSETLDAIGSALGRPLTAQANHRVPTPLQTAPRPAVRRSTSTSNRVSGWLSAMMPSSGVAQPQPYDKRQTPTPPPPLRRTHSDASLATCLSATDSPSLTIASSPTTRGHSRSHTGESRIAPWSSSPVHSGHAYPAEKTFEFPWPTSPTSAVGVAL